MARRHKKNRENDPDEAAYWRWRAALATQHPQELPLAERALFRTLRRYARALLRRRLNANEQEIGYELADQAVALAFTKGASFRAEGKFTSWFYRVVRNLGSQYLRDHRQRGKRGIHPGKLISMEALMQLGREPATTPEALDAGILVSQLRAKLTDPLDQKLFDAKLEGYDGQELCEQLGVYYNSHADNGAHNQWKKLRKQLLELLGASSSSWSQSKSAN